MLNYFEINGIIWREINCTLKLAYINVTARSIRSQSLSFTCHPSRVHGWCAAAAASCASCGSSTADWPHNTRWVQWAVSSQLDSENSLMQSAGMCLATERIDCQKDAWDTVDVLYSCLYCWTIISLPARWYYSSGNTVRRGRKIAGISISPEFLSERYSLRVCRRSLYDGTHRHTVAGSLPQPQLEHDNVG